MKIKQKDKEQTKIESAKKTKAKKPKQTKSKKSVDKKTTQNKGLSFSEKMRLAKLKKKLKNPTGNSLTTAQQTITFKKMYRDGMCQVTKDYYTKMVEFYDINYRLLDPADQNVILEDYGNLINSFDPDVSFQLFLFNRKVNEKTLTSHFYLEPQEDGFEDIREEYTQMLQSQAAKGNNGIIKSKYLLFGVQAASSKEARHRLKNVEKTTVERLNNMGTDVRLMDGKDRLRLLHEYFNQDTMEPFHFSFKEMAASGKSVKDYIAPAGFDFRNPNRFKMGNMYGCVSCVDITAPKLNDELIKKLLEIEDNVTVTMHMQTQDPVEAMKKLKTTLSNIQQNKIDEQKKAVQGGYDMDLLPTDIITYEKDALDLLDSLNSENQKLVQVSFIITCFGKTKHDLDSLWQEVKSIIQVANCNFRVLQYMQEQGLMASAPIGCIDVKAGRTLTTESTRILVPFCTQELFMSAPSIYYGINALSNNMIMADRKRLRNPNGVILGTPGAGKSFAAKREILSCFLTTKDDIICCDPEGEYPPLVNALKGTVVKLATNSKDYLNPMDIQMSHKNDKEALKLKSNFLITLCDHIAGGRDGLENDEKGIIDECIRGIYKDYFEDPSPEKMPILEDLYNALKKHPNEKAERIANSLVLYVHGSQNYFNHRTNVDNSNRTVCFDIRDLGSELKDIGMLIVQDAVWNRVSLNRERNRATRYYCDEFHLLLREPMTAMYAVEMWKRFRKWGGIPTAMTQNVSDFLKSPEIEGILGNSDFVYLLNQSSQDREIVQEKFNLSEKQLKRVTAVERGSGLILFDNVVIPFVDKYPANTKTFRIMDTRPEEADE